MKKTILDIVEREPEPMPWAEGDNIPWDDPEFSERMLAKLSRVLHGIHRHST